MDYVCQPKPNLFYCRSDFSDPCTTRVVCTGRFAGRVIFCYPYMWVGFLHTGSMPYLKPWCLGACCSAILSLSRASTHGRTHVQEVEATVRQAFQNFKNALWFFSKFYIYLTNRPSKILKLSLIFLNLLYFLHITPSRKILFLGPPCLHHLLLWLYRWDIQSVSIESRIGMLMDQAAWARPPLRLLGCVLRLMAE